MTYGDWYTKNIKGREVNIVATVAIAGGALYLANHYYQKYQVEKHGPRNLRQLRRKYAALRLRPRMERGTFTEIGGQPMNLRQLARMGR